MGMKGMMRCAQLVAMSWERVVENTPGLYPTVPQLRWLNSSSLQRSRGRKLGRRTGGGLEEAEMIRNRFHSWQNRKTKRVWLIYSRINDNDAPPIKKYYYIYPGSTESVFNGNFQPSSSTYYIYPPRLGFSPAISTSSADPRSTSTHLAFLRLDDRSAMSSISSSSSPLPDQILENVLETVLQFLTSRRDRNAASLVCRSWYQAEARTRSEVCISNCYAVSPARTVDRFLRVKAVLLKGRPRFLDTTVLPTGWGGNLSPWVASMAPAYPWLEKLCLKRMAVTNENLFVIATSFVHLKELVTCSCVGFGTSGIAAIAEKCMQLRVLDLVWNTLEVEKDDDVVDWVSFFPVENTFLESLVFDCLESEVNFASLLALVARSPQLKRLKVNHHVTVTQLCKLMLSAPQLTHLGTGSFASLPVDDVLFQMQLDELVSTFSASKSLAYLSGFLCMIPEYLPAIYPACANLTCLSLSHTDITAEEVKHVISHCHNLQSFAILDTVRDEGLFAVAASCRDLRVIQVFPSEDEDMEECLVTDEGLIAISEGCPKLRSIIYCCQCMTNAAVVRVSENCPDLVVFRLCIMGRQRREDRITGESMDEGFGAIVKNCRKLKKLAVSGVLTDQAFAYIGEYGKLLRTLSIDCAGNSSSDLGLRYVLEGCSRLQKLEILDSPFGDSGLLSGIHHYYNMRFLWMSLCKLSMNGCREVARKLPRLVVEVIGGGNSNSENNEEEEEEVDGGKFDQSVGKLYMYRSLDGPRPDVPPFVHIL